jgi:hypothetical protein
MKFFRSYIIHRIVSLLMALYILDLRVDANGALPDILPDSTFFSEIGNFFEVLLEQDAHTHDALSDYDNQAEHNETTEVLETSTEFIETPIYLDERIEPSSRRVIAAHLISFFVQHIRDITAPPPKLL